MESIYVYGNFNDLSRYASGSTKTCCMENFPWILFCTIFKGFTNGGKEWQCADSAALMKLK